jgi:hypothetical protein
MFRFFVLDGDAVTLALPPDANRDPSILPRHSLRIVKTMTTGETVTGATKLNVIPV